MLGKSKGHEKSRILELISLLGTKAKTEAIIKEVRNTEMLNKFVNSIRFAPNFMYRQY